MLIIIILKKKSLKKIGNLFKWIKAKSCNKNNNKKIKLKNKKKKVLIYFNNRCKKKKSFKNNFNKLLLAMKFNIINSFKKRKLN